MADAIYVVVYSCYDTYDIIGASLTRERARDIQREYRKKLEEEYKAIAERYPDVCREDTLYNPDCVRIEVFYDGERPEDALRPYRVRLGEGIVHCDEVYELDDIERAESNTVIYGIPSPADKTAFMTEVYVQATDTEEAIAAAQSATSDPQDWWQ